MAIKFFLIYLGSLISISAVIFICIKHFIGDFFANGKKPLLYGFFVSAVASFVACLATFVSKHLFTTFWMLCLVFLLFGVLHVYVVRRNYAGRLKSRRREFVAELLFLLSVLLFTLAVFSTIQYLLVDKNFLFYPLLMSALMFFVPVLLLQTFEAAYAIPLPCYTTWNYPVNQQQELAPGHLTNALLVVGFQLTRNVVGDNNTHFRAKGPAKMPLGDLYYYFINDYNELHHQAPIVYADAQHEPYNWWFRLKRKWPGGYKVLDPGLSLAENGIKENAVIICERI